MIGTFRFSIHVASRGEGRKSAKVSARTYHSRKNLTIWIPAKQPLGSRLTGQTRSVERGYVHCLLSGHRFSWCRLQAVQKGVCGF